MSLQIEALSYESEFHADDKGVYQMISNKIEHKYQGWLNNRKVIDRVETDEKVPDRSAGEYTSFSLQWNDNGTVSIRQFNQINMDDALPGAAPWIWDKTYELEIVKGTREAFEAGQTISLQYTEASLNQVKQDLIAKFKQTYGELTGQVIKQTLLDKGLDDSSMVTETEVVSYSLRNTPMEVSKTLYKGNDKNSESVKIRTILYRVN